MTESIIYKKTREALNKYALFDCLLCSRFIISAPPDYVDGEPFDIVSVDMPRGGEPAVVHVKNHRIHPLPKFNVPRCKPKYSRRGDEK